MKKRIFCALFSMLCVCHMMAQTSFDEFRQQSSKNFAEYKAKTQREFAEYRKKCNETYAGFMRKSWALTLSEKPIPKPKEDEVRPVIYNSEPIEDTPLPVVTVVPIAPAPTPPPEPIAPIEENIETDHWLDFVFCGTECKVRVPEQPLRFSVYNENAFAEVWEKYSGTEYDNMLYDCLNLRRELHLNDWAYLMMLDAFTSEYFDAKGNDATFLMAYIYCQSGYKMRLARTDSEIYLLVASNDIMLERTYYDLDGELFFPYTLDMDNEAYICSASMDDGKKLSLAFTEQPLLSTHLSDARTLQSVKYKDVSATLRVNAGLIELYAHYPTSMTDNDFMTRWAVYANTPPGKEMQMQLYPALQKKLEGLSEYEKVERLLNFVQTAFVYNYDDRVWGRDRAFFAEETLFYPYSDCEDRAILFSRLVRDLVDLDVALVYYPGHLATAVRFKMQVVGDYVMVDNEKYTICDPTYINAPVGATMPRMNNSEAKVILLSNS